MAAEIAKAFPRRPPGVIYAWGDTIFNPGGFDLDPAIVKHENVHGRRQYALNPPPGSTTQWSGPELWWRRYLEEVSFRYQEELYAHAAEYRALLPRNKRNPACLLLATAVRLVHPMYEYGSARPSIQEAMKAIKHEATRL